MSEVMNVFNRHIVRLHRDRAAPGLEAVDFLLHEAADRLDERLDDVARTFAVCLDLGCHTGQMTERLQARAGVETVIACDLSPAMAKKAGARCPAAVADEEWLPFGGETFDLITSALSLHWVNDLPGVLTQVRQALKPDGLFLAVMLGGQTLHELRDSLGAGEIAAEGGLSPRVSPFADVRDAGGLLLRAGFKLPVVDSDVLDVSYPHPLKLMSELRAMGESNAVAEARKGLTRRATLMAAAAAYQDKYATPDGRIPATFQFIHLSAWAPGPGQQKPLQPGSAESRLADALDSRETPLSDES